MGRDKHVGAQFGVNLNGKECILHSSSGVKDGQMYRKTT